MTWLITVEKQVKQYSVAGAYKKKEEAEKVYADLQKLNQEDTTYHLIETPDEVVEETKEEKKPAEAP